MTTTYTASLDVGLQTTATVTGLTAGQTYYFAVTAYNSAGNESPFSNEVSTTLSASATAPVAAFSGSPTSGQAPLAVTFTDASTGSITAWAWDFGDGTTSTLQSPSHTYKTVGTYTVRLTVTGPGGSNTSTKTGYISVTASPPPVAAFTGSPTSGQAPLAVTFTDASTGSITAWAWDFGDGTTSTLQSPSHTYKTVGTYTVRLTVTGPGGSSTATQTGYITVAPALVEVGELSVNSLWRRVGFRQTFVNPIVVVTPLSTNDPRPATVRIRNIGPTGFDIRIQAWDYLSDTHRPETVSYLAMERGPHVLGTGIRVEAGRLALNETATQSFTQVKFTQSFVAAPVVVTSVTSVKETNAVITREKGVTSTGFQVRLQEQCANVQSHATETIDYIAWEPSAGTVDGFTFEVHTTPAAVTNRVYTTRFQEYFLTIPMFLAAMQTTSDNDPTTLRWANKGPVGVDIQVQEETSCRHYLTHSAEVVGYMAFTYP